MVGRYGSLRRVKDKGDGSERRTGYQCDQMARIFFNIGPFIAMEICPKAHYNFPKIV